MPYICWQTLAKLALSLAPVPMAESPATPPPMTRTFAGGTRPAAVICPVKNLPKWLAVGHRSGVRWL